MRHRKRANRQQTDAELILRLTQDAIGAKMQHDIPRLKLAALHMRLAIERRARGLAQAADLRERKLEREKDRVEARDLLAQLHRSLVTIHREEQRKIAREQGVQI